MGNAVGVKLVFEDENEDNHDGENGSLPVSRKIYSDHNICCPTPDHSLGIILILVTPASVFLSYNTSFLHKEHIPKVVKAGEPLMGTMIVETNKSISNARPYIFLIGKEKCKEKRYVRNISYHAVSAQFTPQTWLVLNQCWSVMSTHTFYASFKRNAYILFIKYTGF
jgi:hypothetical protein